MQKRFLPPHRKNNSLLGCGGLTKKIILGVIFWLIIFLGAVFLPEVSLAGTTYYADSDLPIILPRSTWDNSISLNALMTWLPQNIEQPSDWQPVERIVIHHTVSPNNDSINPISRIQSIYRFHAVTQGWGDIGYNYLIDQQGNIYEGRYGGNGSRSAHVYYDRPQDNFNYGSIGIALLGDYSEQEPSALMYDSLSRLVGWLAATNGLDPLQMSRSTFVWNTTTKSFSSKYTLPAVLGHKEIENTLCPGKIDVSKIRQQSAQYAAKFKNYIYQANGLAKIYRIQAGSRQVFESLANFLQQGGSYDKLASIAPSQLDIFSETRFLKYPDGSLVRVNGQPEIFLIEGGKRRHLNVSVKEFGKLGFDFASVREITVDEATNYPEGAAIKYGPDKALLSDGEKVFYIENGKKHWVSSSQLFNVLKFKWSNIKQAPQELAQYLEGSFMAYPNGTLFREEGKQTVYLVSGGQKKEFVSVQSFLTSGFKWSKIISVQPAEAALYVLAGIVGYPDGSLLQVGGSQQVFLVDKGKIRAFLSGEIFTNLGYKWSKIMKITAQELAFYSQGEPVKYREGTLLRAKNLPDVYLVSGEKLTVIDGATFKKKKYKWSQVLVISDQDFNNLYGPSPVVSVAIVSPPAVSGSVSTTTVPTVGLEVPKIRVAIFQVATPSVIFSATSDYSVFDKNGQLLAAKKSGEKHEYPIASPNAAFVKIVPQAADGAAEIISYEDHPAWRPSLNYNKFRGAIEIVYSAKSGKLWAVNELTLEDYLKGVAETSDGDSFEYQKTMTVAARTYAYYYIQKGGKRGADEVYHLNNTTSDQLYKGYGREVLTPSLVSAVQATRGEIVTFGGSPIVAAYSSGAAELKTSGTRSACAVWGSGFCQGFSYLNGGALDPSGTEYKYSTCSGANHCVGLSGAGTRQFAKLGTKNYQEILKYYYLGTIIQKIY
jgi:hypothetical protein